MHCGHGIKLWRGHNVMGKGSLKNSRVWFLNILYLMKSQKDIFRDILMSAETHCVLKIKLKNMRNPVITAVEKVGKKSIVLMPTCLYGYKLQKRNVTLPEIESVIRYRTNFDNPIFKKLRFIKNNIADIRNNFDSFHQELQGC